MRTWICAIALLAFVGTADGKPPRKPRLKPMTGMAIIPDRYWGDWSSDCEKTATADVFTLSKTQMENIATRHPVKQVTLKPNRRIDVQYGKPLDMDDMEPQRESYELSADGKVLTRTRHDSEREEFRQCAGGTKKDY